VRGGGGAPGAGAFNFSPVLAVDPPIPLPPDVGERIGGVSGGGIVMGVKRGGGSTFGFFAATFIGITSAAGSGRMVSVAATLTVG
jgi:hypothetical protein